MSNTHVDGNSVPNFSTSQSGKDIIITSFTCEGTYLWSKVIGGAELDEAYKLALDNNGGIYISAIVRSLPQQTPPLPSTCFDDDDCLPFYDDWNISVPQEGFKNGFLLKYDADNGDFLWRKDYQGVVNIYNRGVSLVEGLQIDSNNVLHTIIGLQEGVHLDGALTVELDEDEIVKYYLLKFDSTTGNLIGTPLLLPIGGFLQNYMTTFRYDETLNRYYISGTSPYSNSNPPISYDGFAFGEDFSGTTGRYCFLISFNPNDLDDYWHREIIISDGGGGNQIFGMEIDDNSDIYITGSYFCLNYETASFGSHIFDNTLSDTSIYSGYRPFVLKINPQGVVQWSKTPDVITLGGAGVQGGTPFGFDLTVNGNEVAIATSGANGTFWESFSISRVDNHGHEPVAVRFNKQTGEVIGLHDILGSGGTNHYLTAITADQDGNYVVGGAMRYSIFDDNPNGIPTLYNTGTTSMYTDFFMARLATTECGTVSNEAFEQPQVRLYPNPTSGIVHIVSSEELQSYEVYNLLGQKVLEGNSNNNFNGNINMGELSVGTYIVKIRTQSGVVMTEKVVRQ